VSADKTCSDCKRLAANARDFAKSLVVRNHISVAEQKLKAKITAKVGEHSFGKI
jgi:hypothetical protein